MNRMMQQFSPQQEEELSYNNGNEHEKKVCTMDDITGNCNSVSNSNDSIDVQDVLKHLQTIGINFIAIDFDLTILNIHTGGVWTGTAKELHVDHHVRPNISNLIKAIVATGDDDDYEHENESEDSTTTTTTSTTSESGSDDDVVSSQDNTNSYTNNTRRRRMIMHCAIVTFSTQIDLIREVLDLIVGNDNDNDERPSCSRSSKGIPIRGDDMSWKIPSPNYNWWPPEEDFDDVGKQPHMLSAIEEIHSEQQQGGHWNKNNDNVKITKETTLLIDDDYNNIQIAIANGIRGAIYLNPNKPELLYSDILKL